MNLTAHQQDILCQAWVSLREHERNPDNPELSSVYEPFPLEMMPSSVRQAFVENAFILQKAGYIRLLDTKTFFLRLTDTGRTQGKAIFDAMLARDGVTEDEFYSDDFGE